MGGTNRVFGWQSVALDQASSRHDRAHDSRGPVWAWAGGGGGGRGQGGAGMGVGQEVGDAGKMRQTKLSYCTWMTNHK